MCVCECVSVGPSLCFLVCASVSVCVWCVTVCVSLCACVCVSVCAFACKWDRLYIIFIVRVTIASHTNSDTKHSDLLFTLFSHFLSLFSSPLSLSHDSNVLYRILYLTTTISNISVQTIDSISPLVIWRILTV